MEEGKRGIVAFNKLDGSHIPPTTSSLMSRNACNGENGETGEKSPAAGDLNWMPKVVPWRLAILVKLAILAKIAMHAMAKLPKNHQPVAI